MKQLSRCGHGHAVHTRAWRGSGHGRCWTETCLGPRAQARQPAWPDVGHMKLSETYEAIERARRRQPTRPDSLALLHTPALGRAIPLSGSLNCSICLAQLQSRCLARSIVPYVSLNCNPAVWLAQLFHMSRSIVPYVSLNCIRPALGRAMPRGCRRLLLAG